MFTKQKIIAFYKAKTVKPVLTALALAAMSLNTACSSSLFTPNLFKKSSHTSSSYNTAPVHGERVRVSFAASALRTLSGVQNTHALIKQRVEFECKDEETIRYSAYLSNDECVSDLMDQLIKNSNIQVLANYHAAPKPKVFARNYGY